MSVANGHAAAQVDWTDLKPIQRNDSYGIEAVLWFDIDNCLYRWVQISAGMSQS